jgi:hypothetical protein
MTCDQIQARADLEALKFSTARKIREALDAARTAAEQANEDADEFEGTIIELVTEENG